MKNMVCQISNKVLVNNDFSYIKDVYEVCINKYLQYPSKSSYNNRGKKILTSEQEVDTYISFYGAHHYYKLIEVFDALNINRFTNAYIETISYGSGAATDTCCLIDYCYTKNISLSVNKITLIDPSIIALKRGIQYIKQSLPNRVVDRLNLRRIYKLLDRLEGKDLTSSPKAIKIHIFSNILDIDSIDIQSLASLIHTTQKGSNYFICVSPNYLVSRNRIDGFYNRLSNYFKLTDIDTNDRSIIGKPIWNRIDNRYTDSIPISRYHRIFKADAI